MNLDKLDRIELSMNDVDKVRKWYDFHSDEIREKGEFNFPFEECLIVLTNGDKMLSSLTQDELDNYAKKSNVDKSIVENNPYNEITIHFKLDKHNFNMEYKIYVQEAGKTDDKPTLSWNVDSDFLKNGEVKWQSGLKNVLIPKDIALEQVKFQTLISFEIFAYMTNVTENVIEKKSSKQITKKGKSKNGKVGKNRVIRIGVTKYIIDFDSKETGRKNDRHSLAWTVRGHWRYYKESGKRVWVKPHVKGQGESTDGKIYKI